MKEGKWLLQEAVDAHGGLERWQAVKEISFSAATGGVALPLKLQFGAFRNYRGIVSADAEHPYAAFTPHPQEPLQGVFQDGTVRVLAPGGRVVAEIKDPRSRFGDLTHMFMWDPLDSLYFGGYAMWNLVMVSNDVSNASYLGNLGSNTAGILLYIERAFACSATCFPAMCNV